MNPKTGNEWTWDDALEIEIQGEGDRYITTGQVRHSTRYTVQLQVQDLPAEPMVNTRAEINIPGTEWIYCGPIPHPSGGECA